MKVVANHFNQLKNLVETASKKGYCEYWGLWWHKFYSENEITMKMLEKAEKEFCNLLKEKGINIKTKLEPDIILIEDKITLILPKLMITYYKKRKQLDIDNEAIGLSIKLTNDDIKVVEQYIKYYIKFFQKLEEKHKKLKEHMENMEKLKK